MTFYAGFDTDIFPGQLQLDWLKSNTNLSWCGYYLAPAPNHPDDSWMGNRQALIEQGWGAAADLRRPTGRIEHPDRCTRHRRRLASRSPGARRRLSARRLPVYRLGRRQPPRRRRPSLSRRMGGRDRQERLSTRRLLLARSGGFDRIAGGRPESIAGFTHLGLERADDEPAALPGPPRRIPRRHARRLRLCARDGVATPAKLRADARSVAGGPERVEAAGPVRCVHIALAAARHATEPLNSRGLDPTMRLKLFSKWLRSPKPTLIATSVTRGQSSRISISFAFSMRIC